MKAIDHIDALLAEVKGSDLATIYRKGYDPMYVDVVVAPFKKIMPWFVKRGFRLLPAALGIASKFAWLHEQDRVMVTIQEAFGGRVDTEFPKGWPQRITTLVEAGFVDLDSPATARRMAAKRKRNPDQRYRSSSTFSGWMNQVNGILLRNIRLGSWQLTRQSYQQWFAEGMQPSTAANIVIDGVSVGSIRRKYKRGS